MKFKYALCINKNANFDSDLVIGKTYTISSIAEDGNWLRLKEAPGTNWSYFQFKLIKGGYVPTDKRFGIVGFCKENYK